MTYKILKEKIVYNIKSLMTINNISQKDLAKKINSSEASISRYLKGERKIPIHILVEIAKVFNVEVSFLICETKLTYEKVVSDLSFLINFSDENISLEQKLKLISIIIG